MKSIEWVATVMAECGRHMLGIKETDTGLFEVVEKYEGRDIEKTGDTYIRRDWAMELIKLMYGNKPTFRQWTN